MAAPRTWDGGTPVAARGRFYVKCPANVTTPLAETTNGGGLGDEVDWLWLFPTTTTPGAGSLVDGAVTVWAWPAGITLADTRPIFVPLNLRSLAGAWTLVLPVTFTALAAGSFG